MIIIQTVLTLLFLKNVAADPFESSYRIEASDCTGGSPSRVITGFVLYGSTEIHTALHGVLGCKNINAVRANDDGTVVTGLTISNVDIFRDIALLSTLKTVPKGTLRASSSAPDPMQVHKVVGFPQGVSGVHSMPVSLQTPPLISLRKRVSPAIIRIFASRGSPSLNLQILDVLGDLQTGHSGAALLDNVGQVVGIVNGGIGRGEFGIGWAIPIQELDLSTYRSSKSALDKLIAVNHSNLFASAIKQSPVQQKDFSEGYKKSLFSIGILDALVSFDYSCPGVDPNIASLADSVFAGIIIEQSNHLLTQIKDDLPQRTYDKITDIIDSRHSSRQGLNDLLDLFNSTTEREVLKAASSAGRQIYMLGMVNSMFVYSHSQSGVIPFELVDDWNDFLSCLRLDLNINATVLAGQAKRLQWPRIPINAISDVNSSDGTKRSIEYMINLVEPRMSPWN